MIWILVFLILIFMIYFLFPVKKLPNGAIIDRIEVYKSLRKMNVYSNDVLLKSYVISLGKNPIGHKEFEGDNKTPEGIYYINARNPNSSYHKNLGISYPNSEDLKHAEQLGKSAGGDIKIHGIRNGIGSISKLHRWKDWTAGCIAVTNKEIDELYLAVETNAQINIRP